ncbi:MAG TPA: helix-turn-helix transcriptional regulator [Spirochaetia bacterium]|nr:helix-turn-helix transcriptional regulator [Spirochaetia bacterium]
MRQVTAADATNGILDFREGLRHFRLQRFQPAEDLAAWIEAYWSVAWDLPAGRIYRQTNISHASINAAVEPEGVFLYGVPGRTFVRDMTGTGSVFGVKFRPGAFFPLYGAPVNRLTGRRIPLVDVFGEKAAAWAGDVASASSNEERAAATDRFWRGLRAATGAGSNPTAATLMAERIISDRSILSAEDAARAGGTTVRSLQRRFQREVGVGPKEVIRRFRLQEAAERLLRDPKAACGDIALELGYFDQAHFIRDFKAVVGVAPDVYRRRQ